MRRIALSVFAGAALTAAALVLLGGGGSASARRSTPTPTPRAVTLAPLTLSQQLQQYLSRGAPLSGVAGRALPAPAAPLIPAPGGQRHRLFRRIQQRRGRRRRVGGRTGLLDRALRRIRRRAGPTIYITPSLAPLAGSASLRLSTASSIASGRAPAETCLPRPGTPAHPLRVSSPAR